jgi:adenine-specific DNA-methyltransferase
MDRRGEIFWSSNGNPRRKIYLDNSGGIPIQDIWLDFKDAHNQNIEITGYPTEKNIEMLEQIVSASSEPGDLVLDCFAGSGTTLVAAENLGRRWVGVDNGNEAIHAIMRRLQFGSRPMGDFVTQKRIPLAARPLELFDSSIEVDQEAPANATAADFCLYQIAGAPEFQTQPEIAQVLKDQPAKRELPKLSKKVVYKHPRK